MTDFSPESDEKMADKERMDKVLAEGPKTRNDVADAVASLIEAERFIADLVEQAMSPDALRQVARITVAVSKARMSSMIALNRLENGRRD